MEIASPTPLSNPFTLNRSKRSFSCAQFCDVPGASPIAPESININDGMEPMVLGPNMVKRRRLASNEEANNNSISSFQNAPPFTPPVGNTPNKRCRIEAAASNWMPSQAQQQILTELRRLVDHQAAEIERLKSTINSNEDTLGKAKAENEKVVHENRILKRAVAIQQERQNQSANELEAARRYKVEADERICRLEQMNLTLQYRLQAQSPAIGNDFMRFGPQPPDVY